MTAKAMRIAAGISAMIVVLVISCSPRPSPQIQTDTVSVKAVAAEEVIAISMDSLVVLSTTGYTVRLPADCRMTQTNDSSFSFTLLNDTCKCARLNLEWRFRQGPVPGTLRCGTSVHVIAGAGVTFKDFPLIGVTCIVRSGAVESDKKYMNINCIAPQGETMDRLFAIVSSLAKTEK